MNVWEGVSMCVGVAMMAVLLFTRTTAFAEGAGAVTFTQNFHNAVQSFPAPNPCTGAPGTVTLTYNGVFHVTALTSGHGAGTDWATGTMTGRLVLTPPQPPPPHLTRPFNPCFSRDHRGSTPT